MIRLAKSTEATILSALALRSKAYWDYDAEFIAACVDELTISAEQIQSSPTYVFEEKGHVLGFYMLESVNNQCGFNSQSHFNKHVRDATGMTPNNYRKIFR
ncbi:MAG: AraC family transcriptional regulator [Cyanobacteria bacterium P01_C01_bin.120]